MPSHKIVAASILDSSEHKRDRLVTWLSQIEIAQNFSLFFALARRYETRETSSFKVSRK